MEPTLVFILQASGTAVLNNEQGFSAQNVRALCDVGNSTKGGSIAGYIGQKGIGFKSVFRVSRKEHFFKIWKFINSNSITLFSQESFLQFFFYIFCGCYLFA